jgi:AraC family transcriptional regulator
MASRSDTITDHKERLNRVLVYIQENIDKPLLLGILADVACFSPFHFHRIFQAYVGETLNDYIRRIRMERAALKLCHSEESITSIALNAGYETSAAFSKAFRLHFGKNPTDFKKSKTISVDKKLLDLKFENMEVKKMQPDIRTFSDQKVLFVRKTGKYDKAASEAWSTLMKFAYSRRLMKKDTKAIGISHDDPDITPEEKIRYDACITINQDVKPEGEVGIQTINGGRYAVFLHKGPYDRLGETYKAIFTQWLPLSGEKLRDVPCFEIYLNRDPRRTKPENLRTEIHVPIE